MLDEKDLQAIAQLMEKQKNEFFEVMQQQTETMIDMIHQTETRINIKIENDVNKRIDSLFDGYKLAHEKQWELERKMEQMEKRLELLESKVS